MESSDLTAVIVVGALVGLLFVALGYGQMVWLSRQIRARGRAPADRWATALSISFWVCLVGGGAAFLHALATRTLPEREGLLVGEDLFSVRPRQGLVASYVTSGPGVHKGEILLRFAGQDGEEAQLAVRSRKQVLESELELEKVRPLELDPGLVRLVDQATVTVRELEQRSKQLETERDAILREAAQQRLAIDNRSFRSEQDDRAAERDLAMIVKSLETQRGMLKSDEELLDQGVGSRVDVAEKRDTFAALEGRRSELADRRAIIARERVEIANLRSRAETTFKSQLDSRESQREAADKDLAAARATLDEASRALAQDRPRAEAQRDKRLKRIEVQIEECDALLAGRGREFSAEAPWDGRIGFREPSPSSSPADNGPLLVMYRPGKLAVAVRLEGDEADADDADLSVDFRGIAPSINQDNIARTEHAFGGKIVSRASLPMGFVELKVAVDPPDRLVRQVAMGDTVPVRARVQRNLTSVGTFRFAAGLAALALGLGLTRALRRRRLLPVSDVPAVWTSPGALTRTRDIEIVDARPPQLLFYPVEVATKAPLLLPAPSEAPPPAYADSSDPRDPRYLAGLGARLRWAIDAVEVAPDLLHQVGRTLRRGGYPAAALVVAGFGATIDKHAVSRAAFGLLAREEETLGEAVDNCVQFLHVMRAIGSERLNGAIDHLRGGLIQAVLAAAQREGESVEKTGVLVQPLTEA